MRVVSVTARFFAAHHAADPDGAFGIGDEQHFFVELIGAAIEGEKLLVRPSEADVDPAGDFVGVESMERLTQFEHHKVGHIDDIVDRAQADTLELGAKPGRAGTDGQILDPPRGIEWALVRRGDL